MNKKRGFEPFITDTNTLYFNSRHHAIDHIQKAIRHGFDFAVVGAHLLIADGLRGNNQHEVFINKKR